MTITSYRDLDAWKLGMAFVEEVYEPTRLFPREELYVLTAQLRRSAVGIPSNVSEGHQQKQKAYAHYVRLALGCQAESQTQLELADRLQLAPSDRIRSVMELGSRVGQVLHGLQRSLE